MGFSRLWRFLQGAPLPAEAAHELRSSLGAVKNALYYVKEFIVENRLEEKDPAVLEVIKHADGEIAKAAGIVAEWQGEEKAHDPPSKPV